MMTNGYLRNKYDRIESEILDTINKDSIKEAQVSVSKNVMTNITSLLTGGITDCFSPLLELNEQKNNNIRLAKLEYLLNAYIDKVDNQEESIKKLEVFIKDNYGNIIFNNILNILDNYPPEKDAITILNLILRKIVFLGDFQKYFSQYMLDIRRLNMLSAQALIVFKKLPNNFEFIHEAGVGVDSVKYNGIILTVPWAEELTNALGCDAYYISIISELIDNNLIKAKYLPDTRNRYVVLLTDEGKRLKDLVK